MARFFFFFFCGELILKMQILDERQEVYAQVMLKICVT